MPTQVISTLAQQQLTTGANWDVASLSTNGISAMEYTYSYPGAKLYVMYPDQTTIDAAREQIQATLDG
jgi:hypothetical protein